MKEVNTKRKRRKKHKKIGKILNITLLVTILIFFGMLFYINIIPFIIPLIGLIITLVIAYFIFRFNLSRKKGMRYIGNFLSIVIILILFLAVRYLFSTLGFLFNVTDGDYTVKNYHVVVLKDSNYNKLTDLDEKDIGINKTVIDDTLAKFQKKLNKKIDVQYKEYDSSDVLTNALINNEVEAIILENSELALIKENHQDNYNKLKSIYELEIKNDITSLKEAVNINKEPFNIYISGIDTYGKINATSRSDVNILVTVNPVSEKILMTWVPRDYYVNINNSTYKDKLTHAGIYGVDSSIYAMEHLLDTKVNYYVKVNFTSVIKIVDILGGITVYNDQTFTTVDNITFNKGNITLSGKDALSFVRERKNLNEGDIGRGKHQVLVLEALMHKAMGKETIKNYNKLLKSLEDAFVTNMPKNAMLGFIRKEITSPRDFKVESNILKGSDAYDYTYSYKNTKLYVMNPNLESVNNAQNLIKDYLKK